MTTESKKETTTAPVTQTPRGSVGLWLATVALALLAGFAGSWGYGWWAARHPSSSLGVQQSKNIVVSEQNATIDIAKRVGPSVVSITTSGTARNIFGQTQQQQGAGTGIIISADGLILTNKHVVEGGESFVVITSDGKEYAGAQVVAKDPTNDIAFLRVQASGLKAAELGDSSKVEIGQFVVAIGNALGQFQNTVTTGVISGKSRPVTASDGNGSAEKLQNLFQTDAAINPGNSGGPLVNIDGQVIGMNTAVAGSGAQNIGFAIPINEVKADISSVQTSGKISRPYIGVRFIPVTASFAKANNLAVDYGAYVYGNESNLAIIAGSPADKAGIRQGDILLKINGTKIDQNNSLISLVAQNKIGDTITVTLFRDGKEQDLKVTLTEAPQNIQ